MIKRSYAQALAEEGFWVTRKTLEHLKICEELNKGKEFWDVADQFNKSERMIRYIKERVCDHCE
jgi:hypothetical protein